MASSALIQGARDMGRAKIYNPYRFQSWIRSMFYGLDKLDDQMYNMKMAELSQLSKIQKQAADRRKVVMDAHNTEMDKFFATATEVQNLTADGQYLDVQPQLQELYNSHVNSVMSMNPDDKSSEAYYQNQQIQADNIKKLGDWKSLLDITSNYFEKLHMALKGDGKQGGDISDSSYAKQPTYWHMLNPSKHTIKFFTNEAGDQDLVYFFDNVTEEEKEFLPCLGGEDCKQQENPTYGITWSDFVSKGWANYDLKNKGQEAQMEATWEKMVENIHDGTSTMYDLGEDGFYKLLSKEDYTKQYTWDPTFRAPIVLKDGTKIGKNEYTNLATLYFDFDPDGVGGKSTMSESVEGLAMQQYYMKYLDAQSPEYQAKVWNSLSWGNDVPHWVLDEDFAFGDVDLGWIEKNPMDPTKPELKKYEHPGRDFLSHAMNIYFGDATYDALQKRATNWINEENLKEKAKQLKAAESAKRLEISEGKYLESITGDNVFEISAEDTEYMTALENLKGFGDTYKQTYRDSIIGDLGKEDLDDNMLTSLVGGLRSLTGNNNLRTAKNAWESYYTPLITPWDEYDALDAAGKEEYRKNNLAPEKPLEFKEWIESKNLNWRQAKHGILEVINKGERYDLVDISKIQPFLDQAKQGKITSESLREALRRINVIKSGVGGGMKFQAELLTSKNWGAFIKRILKSNQ